MGDGAAYDSSNEKGFRMSAFRHPVLFLSAVVTGVLLSAVPAYAVPVVPAVPVDAYGDALLSSLATAITAIFPYAAAITAFAIGVSMVRRWLGHRKATSV